MLCRPRLRPAPIRNPPGSYDASGVYLPGPIRYLGLGEHPGDGLVDFFIGKSLYGNRFGIVYSGHPCMAEYFRRQDGVVSLYHVGVDPREEEPYDVRHIRPQELFEIERPAPYWFVPRLSIEALEWGVALKKRIGDYFLVQALSLGLHDLQSSCAIEHHWPWWDATVRDIGATDENVVVTGWRWAVPGKRILNLTDRIPTIEHLFALVMFSTGFLTTSNVAAIMAALMGAATLTVNNSSIGGSVWEYLIQMNPNGIVMPYASTYGEVRTALQDRFPIRL